MDNKNPVPGAEFTGLSYVEDLSFYLHNDMGDPEIYNQSKKNLETLIELYNRATTVSFIGAGTSIPLGISDWEKLMRDLFEKAVASGYKGSFSTDPREWPQLAQQIYEYYESGGNLGAYFTTLSRGMTPRNNTTTLTLVKIVLAGNVHLTTNFDSSIENAYMFLDYLSRHYKTENLRKEYKLFFLPDFQIPIAKTSNCFIYYLHGSRDKSTYILKKSDYDIFYPSVSSSKNSVDSLENFLKGIYKNYCIVFVGFSFSDLYVRDFFFKLAKQIEKENKITGDFYNQSGQVYEVKKLKHFLIVDSKVSKDYGRKFHDTFQTFNIYPIIYKDGEHIFLERLYENLSLGISI